MKRILLSTLAAAMLSIIPAAQAVVQVFSLPAGSPGHTNIFTLSSRINAVTLSLTSTTGATNLTYALTDSPTNNFPAGWGPLNQTNSSYVQLSSYLTNITKITTNFSGLLITNIYTNALFTYTNTVGQTSNAWRRIAVGTLGSNSAVTITGPFPVVYGLGITNNNPGVTLTITVDYDPAL